ncbi:DUF6491 family protein [Stenotrophomonas maltophilia]|uniref:DUF6491 family protein n=1 Tax=Stenotrophomonas maltophilia TaxID=40324 RepID=UPI0021C61323|nr:DUF6491 family protein [Stenotrophomonas maltophilia]MCU1064122.1 hypothetical protein [Stenotrophomonas maltophilia]HDS1531176.1 hypothetical protein [Stenotrophomonas maltophilia]
MTHQQVSLVFATSLSLMLAASASAQERTPPAPHCMDAVGVQEVEQASLRSIALRAASGQAYRIDFNEDCPGVRGATSLKLEAPSGWACGRPSERVVVDGRRCAISAVTPLQDRDYASVARDSDRLRTATLPAMTIRERREVRRSFGGSPSYCFATRNVRAWSSDPQGMLVETNPHRNGGHRYYRVELGSHCRQLDRAPQLSFHSGLQNGLICGNPGDRITTAGFEAGDLRHDGIAPLPQYTRGSCTIQAVYPASSQASN